MKEKDFEALYEKRGFDRKVINEAVLAVKALAAYLNEKGIELDKVDPSTMRTYIKGLIDKGENTQSRLLALARYFHLIDRHDIYIYFTALFGGLGVLESIRDRLEAQEGAEVCQQVFGAYEGYPLGTDPKDMPKQTEAVLSKLMDALPEERYQRVLAGNNHGIPKESMMQEKAYYEAAESLDQYLEERHQRKVKELQEYCDRNQVWFEQEITQDVVDYVKGNQEMLSAVRNGIKLYVTKIPYDGIHYLKTNDETMKSYYACHCPFAREAILNQELTVNPQWCYCSAGFAKFPFEVIFDRELEVEVLQSALAGDPICRFAIRLPAELI